MSKQLNLCQIYLNCITSYNIVCPPSAATTVCTDMFSSMICSTKLLVMSETIWLSYWQIPDGMSALDWGLRNIHILTATSYNIGDKQKLILVLYSIWNGSWLMDLHFHSSFPIYWTLKGLYNTCCINPFTHIFIHRWQRVPRKKLMCSSGRIWGSVSCWRVLHAFGGSKELNQPLSDDWMTYSTYQATAATYMYILMFYIIFILMH